MLPRDFLLFYYKQNFLNFRILRRAKSTVILYQYITLEQHMVINTYLSLFKRYYVKPIQSPESNNSTKEHSPKKQMKTYITLLGTDRNKSITTIDDARKLADRRHLKLIKVLDFDPKSKRAVYELKTEAQYFQDDPDWSETQSKKHTFIKRDKVVSFSSNISENDLLTKVKLMKKWLSKELEVKVIITGDTTVGVSSFNCRLIYLS